MILTLSLMYSSSFEVNPMLNSLPCFLQGATIMMLVTKAVMPTMVAFEKCFTLKMSYVPSKNILQRGIFCLATERGTCYAYIHLGKNGLQADMQPTHTHW